LAPTPLIFSVVYATLLAPMPYPNPDQLVIVWSKVNGIATGLSRRLFGLEAAEYCLPVSLCLTGGNYSLSTSDHPEMIQTRLTTPASTTWWALPFSSAGHSPRGRSRGPDRVVVMTYRLWWSVSAATATSSQAHPLERRTLYCRWRPRGGQPDRLESQLFVPLAFKPEQINHDFHSFW